MVVALLLARNANRELINRYGKTPLDEASGSIRGHGNDIREHLQAGAMQQHLQALVHEHRVADRLAVKVGANSGAGAFSRRVGASSRRGAVCHEHRDGEARADLPRIEVAGAEERLDGAAHAELVQQLRRGRRGEGRRPDWRASTAARVAGARAAACGKARKIISVPIFWRPPAVMLATTSVSRARASGTIAIAAAASEK